MKNNFTFPREAKARVNFFFRGISSNIFFWGAVYNLVEALSLSIPKQGPAHHAVAVSLRRPKLHPHSLMHQGFLRFEAFCWGFLDTRGSGRPQSDGDGHLQCAGAYLWVGGEINRRYE